MMRDATHECLVECAATTKPTQLIDVVGSLTHVNHVLAVERLASFIGFRRRLCHVYDPFLACCLRM
jgi:hypothetical protein